VVGYIFLQHSVEADGKPIGNASAPAHTQTDGQPKNIMPVPSHLFDGRSNRDLLSIVFLQHYCSKIVLTLFCRPVNDHLSTTVWLRFDNRFRKD